MALFSPKKHKQGAYPIFGICPVTGEASTDDQDPPEGFADPTNTQGNGTILNYFDGSLRSDISISERKEEIDTEREMELSADAEVFLSQVGFKKATGDSTDYIH